jgi:hypothetical protein
VTDFHFARPPIFQTSENPMPFQHELDHSCFPFRQLASS